MGLGEGALREAKNMSDTTQLTDEIREKACELNVDMIGFIPAEAMEEFSGLEVNWDAWSAHKSPREYLPGARSIIVLGEVCFGPAVDLAVKRKGQWNYIGYKPLELDTHRLAEHVREMGFRTHIEHSHLSHKHMARLAGMGCFGKSSLIINPEVGPHFRLESILTDAALAYDEELKEDTCGSCTLCLDECPTGALTPYRIDTPKCLVHQRLLGPDDREYADMLDRYSPELTADAFLMCRRCQDVCPVGRGC